MVDLLRGIQMKIASGMQNGISHWLLTSERLRVRTVNLYYDSLDMFNLKGGSTIFDTSKGVGMFLIDVFYEI